MVLVEAVRTAGERAKHGWTRVPPDDGQNLKNVTENAEFSIQLYSHESYQSHLSWRSSELPSVKEYP